MTRSLREAILQLNHANATLYMVDLKGVYGRRERHPEPEPERLRRARERDARSSPTTTHSPGWRPRPTSRRKAALPLSQIATGGTYFPNQTNFAVALNRIGIQNQLYYLLSFSPTKTDLDGEYRQIAVRVRDRPDLRVIARPGYFARRRGEVLEAAARGDYGYAFPEDVNTYAYLLNPRPHGAFGVLAAALPESSLEEPAELRLRVVGPGGTVLTEASGPVDIRRFWISTPAELPSGALQLELVVERGGRQIHAGSSALVIPTGFGETFSLSSVFPFVSEEHGPEAAGPPVRPVAAFSRAEDARVAFFIFPGREDPVAQGTGCLRDPERRGGDRRGSGAAGTFGSRPAAAGGHTHHAVAADRGPASRALHGSHPGHRRQPEPLCGGRTRVPNSVSGSWAGP